MSNINATKNTGNTVKNIIKTAESFARTRFVEGYAYAQK